MVGSLPAPEDLMRAEAKFAVPKARAHRFRHTLATVQIGAGASFEGTTSVGIVSELPTIQKLSLRVTPSIVRFPS